jgi:hypothetical protein
MTDSPHAALPPAERIPDHARIQEVLRQAVREAPRAHKRTGNPVANLQNERVWVPPDHIPVDGDDE